MDDRPATAHTSAGMVMRPTQTTTSLHHLVVTSGASLLLLISGVAHFHYTIRLEEFPISRAWST